LWSSATATVLSIFALAPSGAGFWKPCRYSSAMKPVESLAERQRGCAIRAVRNGMLWRMPSIAKASSACACASIAAARVPAWVTSLAIIGSYQIEISPPS
jgi:hypothetical protein